MENKSTLLKMISRQRDAEGAHQESVETHRARMREEEGILCLEYQTQGDDVTLRIGEKMIEITRMGMLCMRLCIEPGKTHPGAYETPYGEVDIAVCGHRMLKTCEERRCQVRMEYDVMIDGRLAFSNDVSAIFRR